MSRSGTTHGIILRFPAAGEERLDAAARALGLDGVFAETPPHLTLTHWHGPAPDGIGSALAALAAQSVPPDLVFTGLGQFPETHPILWLAPAPTATLIALHGATLDRLTALPTAPQPHPHTLVGAWTPHVTLTHLHDDRSLDAIVGDSGSALPVTVRPDRIELVSFPPLLTVESWRLGASRS